MEDAVFLLAKLNCQNDSLFLLVTINMLFLDLNCTKGCTNKKSYIHWLTVEDKVKLTIVRPLFGINQKISQASFEESLKHVLGRPRLVERDHVAGVADQEKAEVASGFEVPERGQRM